MKEKINVLYWGDAPAPIVHTGFGVVAKHILKALHNTGKYEIDVLGVNYFGSFYDKKETPYHITPAKLLDPSDPFGNKMLLRALSEKRYDILFILNDTYVCHSIANKLQEYKTKYNQNLKIVYYYPVDCIIRKDASDMLLVADKIITYTEFGRQETLKAFPQLENKLDVIYHGTDVITYHPISPQQIIKDRYEFFGIKPDEKTFVWINVNRNSVRKNLPKTIFCFNEFKKKYPDTKLYLHTVPDEYGIDLLTCAKQLGLSTSKDVIFPVNYSPVNAFAGEVLNRFYNAADCFLSTSLGEGWGIGQCEAMAAGIQVLLPDNTSTPEILTGPNGYRGSFYPCNEIAFVDNSGYRKDSRVEDVLMCMEDIYNTGPIEKIGVLQAARKWTMENSWENITKKWIKVFDNIQQPQQSIPTFVPENL